MSEINQLQIAVDYIELNITEDLKYSEIAKQACMSTFHFQMDDMTRYAKRGYYVKENAPIYFTKDMDKTCQWFCDVLGWYGDICNRDDKDVPVYGCVFDYPGELIVSNLTPFRGIHLFNGEASKGVVGFVNIQELDKFHQFVKNNGWNQISDIFEQPWGAKECSVTTIDGSIIRFFETTV